MVKCLTLNAHSWIESLPLKRLFDIAEHILEEDYDLICLQEINQKMSTPVAENLVDFTKLSDFPAVHEDNYALYLVNYLRAKGRRYYWSWVYNHIGYDEYNEGVALLSKTPFKAEDVLVSDKHDEFDFHTRHVLIAQTEINQVPITVTSLHLSWEGKGFEEEWLRLEDKLKSYPRPYVLMGDFNTPTDSKGYQMILSSPLDLQDCHVEASDSKGSHTISADIDGWEANEADLKVDHIFISKELTVKTSHVSFDGGAAPIVSDHYGIAVEIE